MDTNNWRPAQAEQPPPPQQQQQQAPSMDVGDGDWRSQLQMESRQRIVNKIMETLKRHLPFSGEEGLHELKKIAVRFEVKIYTAATSQSDYLRKISLKMLTMETKSQNQNPMANSLPSNSVGNDKNPPDSVKRIVMDTNNWRPAQAEPPPPQQQAPSMDVGDWRSQLQMESRQRIINKIMETLKRHSPFSGQEGLHELKKIAVRLEEKIYTAAPSQTDYLRKISLKMLTMETKSQNQNPMANSLPSNSVGNDKTPPDSASQSMQSQVHNQGQSIPIPLAANHSQSRQQLLSQNIQNNMASAGVQSSAGIQSLMPSVTTLNQTQMPNVVGQNSNVQNISGISQNVIGNSMGQGVPSNVFANSQRQMQGRQQITPQQQQQHSQNSQYLYQQQLLKQKFPQGNMQHSIMQSHIQQQPQQQNMLQSSQMHPSQQSNMQTSSATQPSVMQSAPLSALQQNQQSSLQQSTQSILQQHPQSVLRQQPPQQASSMHQQQTPMMQQPMLSSQQQQLMGQQPNATNLQQNQLIGQQSSITDMQLQQRLLSQQNNLPNRQQQQLMAQQNGLSNIHQPQLGSQSNPSGSQQQQQLLGSQSGNSGMQTNQHSLHMLQQSKVPLQQQTQQTASNLLPTQGQQPQQQLMTQIQSQSPQLQQQLNLQQQQQNPLQRDIQQRLQTSNAMLQQHNAIDQQKQLFQSQRNLPEASSTSLDSTAQTGLANGGDWQEEVYQKIRTMKEMYLPELSEVYQKIAVKLQQHDSLPQQPKIDQHQLDKFKIFKTMLERIITYLQVSKSNITSNYKDKLGSYEKQILNFLNTNKPRKPVSLMQQGQLPASHMHSFQQSQPAQSQITQVQPHENQTNPQLQAMNLQGSVAPMQQNNVANIQHGSMSSISVVSNAQQNMMNSLQSGSNLDSGQGNTLSSLQPGAVGSLQQNSVSAPNQTTNNTLSSQGGVNGIQPGIQPNINTLQSNSNMLQHQHLKQHQEQQMMQAQQLKQQFQQHQMQQQLMQKQQILQQQQHQQPQQQQQQQLHQQTKQQPGQSQPHQMPQLHQMNDADLKIRQGMGVKSGVYLQHHAAGQRSVYHQQLKSGGPFPISSPQLLQAGSPQIPQHSSPQIDQQNMLSSLTKAGTPLQSAHSPFVVPSPQTPLAPSPIPGDPDKHGSGITSHTNAGNIGHQQANGALAPAQSLAIGTPGISASPLLAEFTNQDGNHGNTSTVISGKSNATEQPLERLIKVVKSMSSKALTASVCDIGSVVSMIDRIAGSAPGNGSRATVGEDLVAMTKCRLQARNFITQDASTGTKRMRRYTSAMPLVVVSSFGSVNDSFKQLTSSETYDLESTATSSIKRPRIEVNHVLLEEIREINQRLIDTVVDVSDEDVDPIAAAAAAAEGCEGTIVKCSFSAVALSPNLKSQYASAQMSPIQPLRLLVPTNYPNCSPVLLDKFPVEISKEHEDLSVKAKSRFSISLRSLSQPMSLGEIARTWDVCARAVISEYAQQSGGGSFSSRYGSWENCLTAA